VDNLVNDNGEDIEERAEKKTDEQVEKRIDIQTENDDDSPKNRMQQLQEEFHMSNSEVDGLTKFISSAKNNAMLDILEEMIHCKTLNIRQKVAFAHALGIFRSEESMSFRITSSQD
jgi:hypothetical protein